MKLLFACVSSFVLFLPSAFADTFKVNLADDLPDALPGDGVCSYLENPPPFLASCTLRAAVMEANATPSLDYIHLVDGVHYKLTIPGSGEDDARTGDLDIRFPVVILSWGEDKPIIDANQMDRVFHIHAPAYGSQLVALQITRGATGLAGGGILSSASNVSFFMLDVYDNRASSGCGIYSSGETRILLNNIFENRSYNQSRDRCSAVHHEGSNAGVLWVEGSSVYRNAGDGIVIDSVNARSTILNSTLSGNTHYGLWFRDTHLNIMNSTLADNGPENGNGVGGGLHSILSNPASHKIIMKNTILDGNRGQNCALEIFYEGDEYQFFWNVSDDGSCKHEKIIAANNLHFTPAHLWHLDDWGGPTLTHKPDYHSPVIDRTIDDPVCSVHKHDQRLLKRKFAFKGGPAYCDTGAVELQW